MYRFHALVLSAATLAEAWQSFEAAAERLDALPRLFIEPDGSFVWTGEDAAERWQVDGNLCDRGPCLAHVELKGWCPAAQFNAILESLGWPDRPVQFELPRRGITLTEREFRRQAALPDGAS